MSGGGKSSTSTSSVSIPPEVLARYNAVNARAEDVAQQGFTSYGGEFVAPLTQTQQAGISNVSQAAGAAQPYYQAAGTALLGGAAQAQPYYQGATESLSGGQAAAAPLQNAAAQNIAGAQAGARPYQGLATGFGLAGARQIAPGGLNVGAYMSPYTEAVAQPTYQALRQQQQQEQQKIVGDQIRSGAFGGDRGKIAQAVLAQQQNLATGQALGNIYQQGYGQALGAAQQQQGVALQAEQANRQAQQQAAQQFLGIGQQGFGQGMTAAQQQAALGQQLFGQGAQAAQTQQALGQGLYGIGAGVSQGLAGLGTGAQQAALQGGQAQLAAGTVEQQTQQANNQALYNQFLQEQGYPFQVAQFLANIAMGTGALSGSTTTTTQPSSFFSDERLKHDIEPIGKTFDGQDIVRFKYKGEPGTRIGLVAQDVEKKHPEAVGLAGGYKTVNYEQATDDAAARAPKAYGGGLSPWDGSSMGGGVFREDAGAGFAAGGAPGGDDVLAQINALVNSHQGIFPYGKSGLYGASSGKSGPYGSSLMQPGSRGLMRAENVGPRPVSTMEGIESTVRRAENIGKMYQGAKGGIEFVKEESQLSPTYTQAGQGPTPSGQALGTPVTLRDRVDALVGGDNRGTITPEPGMYRGGAIRPGLAMGGLPYSQAENEYVPEDVSKPIETPKLQTPQAQMKDQGAEDAKMAMQMASTAAAIYGASDRRLKENIEPIGKLFDGQKVYRYNFKGDDKTQIGLMAQEVEKRHPDAVGLAPRKGFTRGGGLNIPEAYQPMVDEVARERGVPPHILGAVLRHESGFNPEARGEAGEVGLGQILPSTARRPGFGLNPVTEEDLRDPRRNIDFSASYIAARNPNVDWSNPVAAARALAANYNAGGDPNYAERVIRYMPGVTEDQIAEVRAQRPEVRASVTQEGGLAPSERRQQATPEGKDWFGRNESWIMPLVTGLGTMASSPSRYLGSAVLQGLMGAGQAAQQNIALEGQRLKTAEETKKIGEEAELTRQRQRLTGASTQQILSGIASGAEDPNRRTVRIFRNGRYTLIPREEFYNNPGEYQLYLAPYSAEERARLPQAPGREPAPSAAPGTPSREPGAPPAEPGAPAGGGQPAPDGSRPDAAPMPPPTVPTTRSTDPVALVTSLPEETRNLADQEIRVARGQSTTDLRAAAERIPSAQDVFTTSRTRASAASGSLPDRLNLAKEFMALPDEGIGSLGRANVFLTPMLSWANSTLRLFNVQDRDGNLVQLNPRQLAGLEAIDKETIQSALNRQGQSGSRAFAELNAILSATPNTQMTRETVQKILAGNFVEEQRAIDLDNFTNLWRNYALQGRENAVGVSADELRLTGPQVEREFNRLYPPAQYTREKAGIEKILDSRVGGRPLIDLIIESRGAPSQPMIEYMNNNFANEGGARLLRHFYGR